MVPIVYMLIASLVYQFQDMNPAYLELVKIFVGSIGWIGGLTLFMWWREKNKKAIVQA